MSLHFIDPNQRHFARGIYKNPVQIGQSHILLGGDYNPLGSEFIFNSDVFGFERQKIVKDGFQTLEEICREANSRDVRNSILLDLRDLTHYSLSPDFFEITQSFLNQITSRYTTFQRGASQLR